MSEAISITQFVAELTTADYLAYLTYFWGGVLLSNILFVRR